jgi:hypothetical protein
VLSRFPITVCRPHMHMRDEPFTGYGYLSSIICCSPARQYQIYYFCDYCIRPKPSRSRFFRGWGYLYRVVPACFAGSVIRHCTPRRHWHCHYWHCHYWHCHYNLKGNWSKQSLRRGGWQPYNQYSIWLHNINFSFMLRVTACYSRIDECL